VLLASSLWLQATAKEIMTSNMKGGKNSIHVVWASPNWSVDRFEALSVACDSKSWTRQAFADQCLGRSAAAVDGFFTC